jgi:hypothetical protein
MPQIDRISIPVHMLSSVDSPQAGAKVFPAYPIRRKFQEEYSRTVERQAKLLWIRRLFDPIDPTMRSCG